MAFLPGTGRHRVQIAHFFRRQIGSWTPSGIGPRSGSRLRRMRRFLELFGELWIEKLADLWSSPTAGWGPVLICIYRWKPRRMRCRRLPTCSTDPRRLPRDLRAKNRQESDRVWSVGSANIRFRGPRPSYLLLDAVDARGILTVALPESSARPRPGRCGSWMRTPVDAGFFWISAVS